MAKGYKIRLGDGSEIGPMDLQAVKDWYAQGLIGKDGLVLRPGSKRWEPVARALELQSLAAKKPPAEPAQRRPGRPAPAHRAAETPPAARQQAPRQRSWRTVVTALLLVIGAAGAGYLALSPERRLPTLDPAPWKEIALAQVALALLLVPGRDLSRRFVRIVVLLAAFALFPVAGILVAQGVRGPALLVLLAAWLLISGLVALLAASLSIPQAVASLLLVAAGAAGIVRLGYVPETAAQRALHDWARPERRLIDAGLGVTLDVPAGWLALKQGQTVVPEPPGTRFVLADPRRGGFAWLVAQPAGGAPLGPDEVLARWLDGVSGTLPPLAVTSRSEAGLAHVSAREAVGTREAAGGKRLHDVAVAWRDGWTLVGLRAWIEDDGTPAAPQALRDVVGGLTAGGAAEARLRQAVDEAVRESPQLSPAAAELVMGRSDAGVLPPEEAFRQALELTGRGLSSLSAAEAAELGSLVSGLGASLPRTQRLALDAYVARVRAREATAHDDDLAMCRLMGGAAAKLPPARLARLQALYEKAIRAALGG